MSELYAFERLAFDPVTLELWRDDARVPLEPMPARLLARLLERAGEMVTREELLELGWPRLPQVADASLNTCVRQIRAALGDDAHEPRFVETLRGRGYRFVARVEIRTVAAPAIPATVPAPARGTTLRWAALAVAATAAVVLATSPGGSPRIPDGVLSELTKARLVYDRYQDPAKALALLDTLVADHAGAAPLHTSRAEFLLMIGRHDDARRAVGLGLAPDGDDAVGLRVLGSLHMYAARWDAAEAALGRSLDRDPRDAATWVANAFLATVRGRFAEAERSIARALELDPLSPTVQGDVGLLHMWAGRYDDAVASCRDVIALSDELPAWAIECAFDALVLAGRTSEAATWAGPLLMQARLVPPDALAANPDAGDEETVRALRAARLGVVRAWEASGKPVRPYAVALACAAAGEVETALDALETALREPGFGVLSAAVDPRFGALHGEPRFLALVSRLGLEVPG